MDIGSYGWHKVPPIVEKEFLKFVRNYYVFEFIEIQNGSFNNETYKIYFDVSYDKLKNHRRVDILNVVLKNP